MAVERAPAYESATETRIGIFEHDTEGHEAEDKIFLRMQETGLPVERAPVEKDEDKYSGYDFRIGPVKIDVTMKQEKYEKEVKELEAVFKQGMPLPEQVVLPVKVGKRDPELIRSDANVQREMARETWDRTLDEIKRWFPRDVTESIMKRIAHLMNKRQKLPA